VGYYDRLTLRITMLIGVLIKLYWICRLRIGGYGLRWGYLLMRGLIWNGIYCLSPVRVVVMVHGMKNHELFFGVWV
jgi:hypothetical protein